MCLNIIHLCDDSRPRQEFIDLMYSTMTSDDSRPRQELSRIDIESSNIKGLPRQKLPTSHQRAAETEEMWVTNSNLSVAS